MNKMIGIGLVLLLGSVCYAGDNCYVHERGSESWVACKEQAGEQERVRSGLDARLRDISEDSARALTQDTQTEALRFGQVQAWPSAEVAVGVDPRELDKSR